VTRISTQIRESWVILCVGDQISRTLHALASLVGAVLVVEVHHVYAASTIGIRSGSSRRMVPIQCSAVMFAGVLAPGRARCRWP
jgi:hypothetical protein